MVATHVLGGLGNQLFSYAAGRALAWRRGDVLQVRKDFFAGVVPFGREYLLDHFAGPRSIHAPALGRVRSWVFRLVVAFARNRPSLVSGVVLEGQPARFESRVRECRSPASVDLVGYWQSERYFEDFRKRMLADLAFVGGFNAETQAVVAEIEAESDPVAVHFRAYRDIADAAARSTLSWDYARHACARIQKSHPRARLFLFADEPEQFREAGRSLGEHRWVTHNQFRGNRGAVEDLHLMSRCRHFVVANSSLSWWGAWLSQQRWGVTDGRSAGRRTVIAPSTGVFNADFVPVWWTKAT